MKLFEHESLLEHKPGGSRESMMLVWLRGQDSNLQHFG